MDALQARAEKAEWAVRAFHDAVVEAAPGCPYGTPIIEHVATVYARAVKAERERDQLRTFAEWIRTESGTGYQKREAARVLAHCDKIREGSA
jgi:hypothetical protein